MADQFEHLIREALNEEAEMTVNSPDLFPEIRAGIYPECYMKQCASNFKKPLAAVIFCTIVSAALLFGFSGQSRILAAEAIDAIKTFFILDEDMKVIEKPSDEVYMTYSVSRTTTLSDEELGKLLGYGVSFPETLPGGYILDDRTLGLSVEKEMLYETYKKIESSMLKALEDDNELHKLEEYGPCRNVSGTYKNKEGSTIFINASPMTEKEKEAWNSFQDFEKVKVGSDDGYWMESPIPIYPFKTENGVGSFDLSKPPVEVKTTYSLYWKNENLKYLINSYLYDEQDLTLELVRQIACEFMKKQP